MKVQNKDNKGNPYHSDANGQFTSKDGGETVNNDSEELGKSGFTEKSFLSSDFEPKMSDEEYLSWLDELDLYEDEVEEEQENKLKPIGKMTQEEAHVEIKQRLDSLLKKGVKVSKNFFNHDIGLKCGILRQIDTVIEKYGIDNLEGPGEPYKITMYNIDTPGANWAFAERNASYLLSKEFYERFGGEPPKSGIMNTRMRFNIGKMSSYSRVVRSEAYSQKIGYHPETDEDFLPEATACHEMGHVLSNFIVGKRLKEKVDLGALNQYSLLAGQVEMYAIKGEIQEIFLQQNPGLTKEDMIKETSEYGETDIDEWFAETFLSMNGGKPNKTALAMKQWLDEQFKFNGGNK